MSIDYDLEDIHDDIALNRSKSNLEFYLNLTHGDLITFGYQTITFG